MSRDYKLLLKKYIEYVKNANRMYYKRDGDFLQFIRTDFLPDATSERYGITRKDYFILKEISENFKD